MSDSAQATHLGHEPRRAVTLAAAHRRTRLVRRLRLALWAAAALLAALIVGLIVLDRNPTVAAPEPEIDDGAVRMANPRFTGRDASGNAFIVTANQALRRPGETPNLTDLENPALRIEPDGEGVNSTPTEADALRGVYDNETKTLQLEADVDLATDSGYRFKTSRAQVNLADRTAQGDQPVEVTGPVGRIQAQSWRFEDDGRVMHFEGDVQTVLYEDETDAPAPVQETEE